METEHYTVTARSGERRFGCAIEVARYVDMLDAFGEDDYRIYGHWGEEYRLVDGTLYDLNL